ncbi:MAG TPA: hypothetical protein VFQ06_12440 [Nitrospira sp.]|nr:hypothetical protein [Nitrospira sp.]
MKFHGMWMIGLALMAAAGCNGTTATERMGTEQNVHQRPDPVLDMLHRGVIDLNESIDELKREIAELQQLPAVSDPHMQQLYGLDLAAWQLHLQQWVVQRDRLLSSLDFIQQAQAFPQDKAAIGDRWSERQAEYLKVIEELRTQRRTIEQKRSDVESQVLRRYFN